MGASPRHQSHSSRCLARSPPHTRCGMPLFSLRNGLSGVTADHRRLGKLVPVRTTTRRRDDLTVDLASPRGLDHTGNRAATVRAHVQFPVVRRRRSLGSNVAHDRSQPFALGLCRDGTRMPSEREPGHLFELACISVTPAIAVRSFSSARAWICCTRTRDTPRSTPISRNDRASSPSHSNVSRRMRTSRGFSTRSAATICSPCSASAMRSSAPGDVSARASCIVL
jgi:hypothetical protein